MATKVNYSDADLAKAVTMYNEGREAGKDNATVVAAIAAELGKTTRSVQSKLSRENVYVKDAAKAPAAKADEGPTKKEMLADLRKLVSWDVDGLNGANKEAIAAVLVLARETADPVAEDEEVEAEAEAA